MLPAEAKTAAMPYVMAAGQAGLYEINSSQIALERSENPRVRRFAAMLITHHQTTTAATMAAAREAGVDAPAPMLDPGAMTSINELQTIAPADFDRTYLAQQVPAHQAAVDLHHSFGMGGNQPALRMSAKKAVPIVKQHLAAAERMQYGAMTDHRGM